MEISLCPPCLCVQNIVESSSWPQAAVLFSCSAHVHENVAYLASLQLIFQKKFPSLGMRMRTRKHALTNVKQVAQQELRIDFQIEL